jgi:hypothetical protein
MSYRITSENYKERENTKDQNVDKRVILDGSSENEPTENFIVTFFERK